MTCSKCHGRGASVVSKETGNTVYYCNCEECPTCEGRGCAECNGPADKPEDHLEELLLASIAIARRDKLIESLREENWLLKQRVARLTNPKDFNLQAPIPALLRKQI